MKKAKNDKEQSEKFIAMAKKLSTPSNEESFAKSFDKIVSSKLLPKTRKKDDS